MSVLAQRRTWAARRSGNLDRMIASAKRNDADLFSSATSMLDVLAKLLTGVGDEAGAHYAASIARLLDAKRKPR